MNDILFHIQSRLVDGREQQCLANDGRGSYILLLAIPVAYLFIYAIGLLAEIQESLSTVPQATSVPGPLCCAEKRQGSDRVHQSFP